MNINNRIILAMFLLSVLLMASIGIKAAGPRQIAPTVIQSASDTIQLISEYKSRLQSEIVLPTSNLKHIGSYLTESQAKVRKLIQGLSALGPRYADHIYIESESDTSESSRALIISLGLIKDPRVHDRIKNIVLNEADPNVKAMAVVALAKYQDTLDVPIFVFALSDTNRAYFRTDFGYPGDFVMIVGINAIGALYEMGYEAKYDPINKRYNINKRK
jgi:hypothetical protein